MEAGVLIIIPCPLDPSNVRESLLCIIFDMITWTSSHAGVGLCIACVSGTLNTDKPARPNRCCAAVGCGRLQPSFAGGGAACAVDPVAAHIPCASMLILTCSLEYDAHYLRSPLHWPAASTCCTAKSVVRDGIVHGLQLHPVIYTCTKL